MTDRKQINSTNGYYHRLACKSYCKALKFGVKYVYQTLPKLLTVWLDFADEEARNEKTERYDKKRCVFFVKRLLVF